MNLKKILVSSLALFFRIACMSRTPLDIWGLDTSESLKKVLAQTKTVPVVQF